MVDKMKRPLEWETAKFYLKSLEQQSTVDIKEGKPTEKAATKAKRLKAQKEKEKAKDGLLLFAVGIFLGFRISDMIKMKFGDFKGDSISILEQKTVNTRKEEKRKPRTIALNDVLKNIVLNYQKENELKDNVFLFRRFRTTENKHIARNAFTERIKSVMKLVKETSNVAGHTLRKTYALRFYNIHQEVVGDHRALNALSSDLGHSKTETTRTYICLEETITNKIFKDNFY